VVAKILNIDNFRRFEGFVYEPANVAVPRHCISSLFAAIPEAQRLEQRVVVQMNF
jgi:hypothetical protein